MRPLDGIVWPCCIHPFHKIRKILAECRMVYGRSYIYRMVRNHLPGTIYRKFNVEIQKKQNYWKYTKKCRLQMHIFDVRILDRRLKTKNETNEWKRTVQIQRNISPKTYCDPWTFGKLVSIALSYHTNCTNCMHHSLQHFHYYYRYYYHMQMDCRL